MDLFLLKASSPELLNQISRNFTTRWHCWPNNECTICTH